MESSKNNFKILEWDFRSSLHPQRSKNLDLVGHCTCDLDDKISTSGYCVSLISSLIAWHLKKQKQKQKKKHFGSRLSTKAN